MVQRWFVSKETPKAADAVESKVAENGYENLQTYLDAYPLKQYPNWSLTNDVYYVQAPIDKFGDFAYHLRTHLTALILAGNPAIEYLQRRKTPSLTILALFFSKLGLEEFFFTLVASSLWLFDARLGRLLSALLALGFFVSGSLKVLLCLPRPPSPPALRLSEEDKDWAWPSNHALIGTLYPWFIWIYASSNYDLSFVQSLLLLCSVLTWNFGVIWSRVYLGVHSPCDIAGGWIIGVVLLFIYCGFSSRLDEFYLNASAESPWKLLYFPCIALFALYIQPRAWPESQSFGEIACVVPGALIGVFASRIFLIGGSLPHLSLYETSRDAPFLRYVARFVVGCCMAGTARFVVKFLARKMIMFFYKCIGISYYSFSSLCESAPVQPTRRYTSRMRFKPISNKPFSMEEVPYDIDLPIKFIVYSVVGFTVSELSPATFTFLNL